MNRLSVMVAALMLAPAVLAACSGGSADNSAYQQDSGTVVEIPARWATDIASSVPALTEASDVVFVGRVVRPLPQRSERLPGRANGGTGTEFPISAFEVAVESVMSGPLSAGASVVVEQPGGTRTGSDGAYTVVLERDERIRPGQTYIFFATQKENGTLTAPPFGRFVIGQDGKVDAPDAWQELPASQELSGMDMAEAAAVIEGAGE
jgi:hypothetical protein